MYVPKLSRYRLFKGIIKYIAIKDWLVLSNLKNKRAQTLFKHPYLTSFSFILHNTQFNAKYKDGRTFSCHDIWKFYDFRSFEYSEFKNSNIIIKHAEMGETEEVFSGAYDWLPVEDRIVIDVGANIGDSPIYFAFKGAKYIYGLEVNPLTYKIANDNVKLNGLEDNIEMLNCGIGKGNVKIRDNLKSNGGFQPDYESNSDLNTVVIELISLKGLLDRFGITDAVLKIDCEGCEYDAIIDADCSTLSKFSHIIGEYHYDYLILKKKLESCSFKTQFTEPNFFYLPTAKYPKLLVGKFMAWR